jgi:hypothetical protein
MNVSDAVEIIVGKGFTERQARFLTLVLRHAGVCVMRQYCAFASVVLGDKTCKFFKKLERLGYVSTYECVHNRARIYHLRHRELYEAIGEPESRLRRPPSVPRTVERLMVLDAMLDMTDVTWLATGEEKVEHLTIRAGVPRDALPRAKTTHDGVEGITDFPDRLPIGICRDGRVVLIYLSAKPLDEGIRDFAQRHAAMLAKLPAWTIRIAVPVHIARGVQRLEHVAVDQLATPLRTAVIEELRWYFARLRAGQPSPSFPDRDERFERDRAAFADARFPVLYRAWRQDGDTALTLASSTAISDALKAGAGRIEPLVLPHNYSHLAPLAGVA